LIINAFIIGNDKMNRILRTDRVVPQMEGQYEIKGKFIDLAVIGGAVGRLWVQPDPDDTQ
jgi:hypothetical protein